MQRVRSEGFFSLNSYKNEEHTKEMRNWTWFWFLFFIFLQSRQQRIYLFKNYFFRTVSINLYTSNKLLGKHLYSGVELKVAWSSSFAIPYALSWSMSIRLSQHFVYIFLGVTSPENNRTFSNEQDYKHISTDIQVRTNISCNFFDSTVWALTRPNFITAIVLLYHMNNVIKFY